MDATFVWLVALTLRSTVVLSAAPGPPGVLRRSSAVARHRLLTLTAVGLLTLPALPGVLPRLALPISHLRAEPSSLAPAPAVTRRTEITVTTGIGDERSSTPPAALRAVTPAAAPAVAGHPSQRGVSYPAAFGAAAVLVWLFGVLAALVGLARALRRERRLLAASRLLGGRW